MSFARRVGFGDVVFEKTSEKLKKLWHVISIEEKDIPLEEAFSR